jgi:hypothetical protein
MTSPFQKVISDVQKKREKAIKEAVIMIEADAKLLAPVDTGTLKRSITHEVKSDVKKTTGSVGTNVEYAYWADRDQPYLSASVDKNQEAIKRKMEEVLKP